MLVETVGYFGWVWRAVRPLQEQKELVSNYWHLRISQEHAEGSYGLGLRRLAAMEQVAARRHQKLRPSEPLDFALEFQDPVFERDMWNLHELAEEVEDGLRNVRETLPVVLQQIRDLRDPLADLFWQAMIVRPEDAPHAACALCARPIRRNGALLKCDCRFHKRCLQLHFHAALHCPTCLRLLY